MTDTYDKFSSQRGILSAKYTKSRLTDSSIQYLEKMNREGKAQFMLGNRKCLAVHGSLENPLWKSIYPDKIGNEYSEYDYVFSGHSHREHFFLYTMKRIMRNIEMKSGRYLLIRVRWDSQEIIIRRLVMRF